VRSSTAILAVALAIAAHCSLQAVTISIPADRPTIQSAIDTASPGDTIRVVPQAHDGPGNRDLDFRGKNVMLAMAIDGVDGWIDRPSYLLGWNSLSFVDRNAIIITNGDADTFPIRYLQIAEDLRTDIDVVCLPMLMSPEYVRLLKDRGVPMTLTEAGVDALSPFAFIPREVAGRTATNMADFVLFDIINESRDERPIYFAVTVADYRGFYDNLSLEGVVFRLVDEVGKHQTDLDAVRKNAFENYRYDYIFDLETGCRLMSLFPVPDRTAHLVRNYAAGFSRLAFAVMREPEPDIEEAIRLYGLALLFAPDYGPALNGLIAIHAVRRRDPQSALPYAERLINGSSDNPTTLTRFAGVHLMIAEELEGEGREEEARPYLEISEANYGKVLAEEPQNEEIAEVLKRVREKLGREEDTRTLGESSPERGD
jgi:tetratricopeptide (TPR) repeat protein